MSRLFFRTSLPMNHADEKCRIPFWYFRMRARERIIEKLNNSTRISSRRATVNDCARESGQSNTPSSIILRVMSKRMYKYLSQSKRGFSMFSYLGLLSRYSWWFAINSTARKARRAGMFVYNRWKTDRYMQKCQTDELT